MHPADITAPPPIPPGYAAAQPTLWQDLTHGPTSGEQWRRKPYGRRLAISAIVMLVVFGPLAIFRAVVSDFFEGRANPNKAHAPAVIDRYSKITDSRQIDDLVARAITDAENDSGVRDADIGVYRVAGQIPPASPSFMLLEVVGNFTGEGSLDTALADSAKPAASQPPLTRIVADVPGGEIGCVTDPLPVPSVRCAWVVDDNALYIEFYDVTAADAPALFTRIHRVVVRS